MRISLREFHIVTWLLGVAVCAGCAGPAKNSATTDATKANKNDLLKNQEKVTPANEVRDEPLPEERKSSKTYNALSTAIRGGKSVEIVDEASKILSTDANDRVVLNALALFHYRKGRSGAARLLLARAIEKGEPTATLMNNLGVIYFDDGETGQAISSFKKALSLDANHLEALGNLGSVYSRGGDYARALPLLERAHKLNPRNNAVANNYGVCLRAQGQYEEAKKIYEGILEKNKGDANSTLNASVNLAILLIEYMKRPKDGMVIVTRAKALNLDRKEVRARLNVLERKALAEIQ